MAVMDQTPAIHPSLKRYVARMMPELTPSDLERVADSLEPLRYEKGEILTHQGSVADRCFFVLEGCLRMFSVDEHGNEHTVEFFVEEQSVTVFDSFRNGTPSLYSIECLESALLLVGDRGTEDSAIATVGSLERATRGAVEREFGAQQHNASAQKALSPEERFLRLLETRPGLAGRVPQRYLASYLGIAPESLSRIKSRLYRRSIRSGRGGGPR